MKKLFLAGLSLLWLCYAFTQTLPEKLQLFYAPLDKSQTNTGYLYDLAVPLVEPSNFKGVLANNYVDINTFGAVFGEMWAARTASASDMLPEPSVYLSKIKSIRKGDPIPMAQMVFRFDRLRPDAFDANLVNIQNNQVFYVFNGYTFVPSKSIQKKFP